MDDQGTRPLQGTPDSRRRTTPSQAEGDRGTVEEDICRQEQAAAGAADPAQACAPAGGGREDDESQLPSQAEGERDVGA